MSIDERELANEFNKALQYYFYDPENKKYQRALVLASYHIHKYAHDCCRSDNRDIPAADDYMLIIENILNRAVPDIKMSEKEAHAIQRIIRGLPHSEDHRNNNAFDVVNLAYENYLKKNVVSSHHDNIRTQLFYFRQDILNQLGSEHLEKVNNSFFLLKTIIDEHFSRPVEEQKEYYPQLVSTIKNVLTDIRNVVEKNSLLNTIAYNFIAAIVGLGVFYGLYLYNTQQNRSSFFLETKAVSTMKAATNDLINALEQDITQEKDAPQSSHHP